MKLYYAPSWGKTLWFVTVFWLIEMSFFLAGANYISLTGINSFEWGLIPKEASVFYPYLVLFFFCGFIFPILLQKVLRWD